MSNAIKNGKAKKNKARNYVKNKSDKDDFSNNHYPYPFSEKIQCSITFQNNFSEFNQIFVAFFIVLYRF